MAVIRLAIVNYPHSLKSAVFGIAEQFSMANDIASELGLAEFVTSEMVDFSTAESTELREKTKNYDYVVIPPATTKTATQIESQSISEWLQHQHKQNAVLTASCVGVFLLANSGLLDNQPATTHWGLRDELTKLYPGVRQQTNELIIDLGQLITAGGMMSWVDLNLKIVARVFGPQVMSILGKQLLVDVGDKAQQYYQRFVPNKRHTDKQVLETQQYIEQHYSEEFRVSALYERVNLTERTLQRRFKSILGMSPLTYLQKTRIQSACEQLELTSKTIDQIAFNSGYQDINAFRKTFVKTMGLTPSSFRKKFKLTSVLDKGVEKI